MCLITLYLSCFRLLLLEGGPGSPSCLLGGKHSVSWGFEDMLPTSDNSAGGAESKGRNHFESFLNMFKTNKKDIVMGGCIILMC